MLVELKNFFAMGGYGFYIWIAYGMGLIIFLLNISLPFLQRRKLWRSLRKQLASQQAN